MRALAVLRTSGEADPIGPLALGSARYGGMVPGPSLRAMTKPRFDRGGEHGCRFFVVVTDRMRSAGTRRYRNLPSGSRGIFPIMRTV